MKFRFFVLMLASMVSLAAEPSVQPEDAKKAPPARPNIIQLSETDFQLGQIIFNSEQRSISFPAKVEVTNQPLEYLVVNSSGKVHETLFISDIDAAKLNIVLKLLRYKPSPELFPILREDFTSSGIFPKVSPQLTQAAKIWMQVSWKEGEKLVTRSVNSMIQHEVTTKQMPEGPLLYNGSTIYRGKFQAAVQGNIITLKRDRSCVINDPKQRLEDENEWLPFPERVPAHETPVTITLLPNLPNSAEQAK